MNDADSLLDELDGRLTAVSVKFQGSQPFIWSFQKHVRFALSNPKERRLGKLLKKGKQWLHEMSWKHPVFREDFMPMVAVIDKFEAERNANSEQP